MNKKLILSAIIWMAVPAPVLAHFQLIYTPESALTKGQATSLALVFTHPFNAGHTMNMGKPESFYLLHQRGEESKPKRVDLQQYLKAVTWISLTNSGQAYIADFPKKITRSMGDYVFVLTPSPYYEKAEDKYIQQITKMTMNVGGIPGNWANAVGLPTEIVPLDKPYANWTGGVFRGVVLSNGEPVANAELEIEYVNHNPDLSSYKFSEKAGINAPQSSFETMGIRTNDRGEFFIGLPKAGWWGICALATGPQTEHKGKELSQDAVLWVQVTDIK